MIVPYLRGYGTTNFLSGATFRNAQQSAVASDIIALMDSLKINKAILGGFDWGSRTAGIIAALWPQRCKALVAVSGYLITTPKAQMQPLPPVAEYGWWYQYYFSTERGVLGYSENRHEFNKLIWKIVSRDGTSMMQHSSAPPHLSTIQTMSALSSIITVGDWVWLMVTRNTTGSNRSLPLIPLSQCPQLP